MRKVKLSTCGNYVLSSKISTNNLTPENYITTDNMLPDKAGIIYSENIPKNTRVTQFLKDDILLSNIRPYFKKIWLAEYTGGCSADVLVFRTNDKYDPKYIKYCLSQDAFFAYDMAGSKGSKMPRGDKNHILNFELLDYDIATQKNIGNLLLSIDNKIKINNKINTELEKFAKTLYEYWFIQFDFPDEFGRPYKSSGGAMVYNDVLKREIPVCWEVKNLFDAMDVQYGYPFNTDMFFEESDKDLIPVVRIRDILDNTVSAYSSEIVNDKYKLFEKDLVIGMDGNFHMNFWKDNCSYLNQRSVRIRKKEPYNISTFQAYYELMPYIKAREKNISRTTVGHLSDKDLKRLNIIIPKTNNNFNPTFVFENLLQKIIVNRKEIADLVTLRDFLLPMLMNGQIAIIAE